MVASVVPAWGVTRCRTGGAGDLLGHHRPYGAAKGEKHRHFFETKTLPHGPLYLRFGLTLVHGCVASPSTYTASG